MGSLEAPEFNVSVSKVFPDGQFLNQQHKLGQAYIIFFMGDDGDVHYAIDGSSGSSTHILALAKGIIGDMERDLPSKLKDPVSGKRITDAERADAEIRGKEATLNQREQTFQEETRKFLAKLEDANRLETENEGLKKTLESERDTGFSLRAQIEEREKRIKELERVEAELKDAMEKLGMYSEKKAELKDRFDIARLEFSEMEDSVRRALLDIQEAHTALLSEGESLLDFLEKETPEKVATPKKKRGKL